MEREKPRQEGLYNVSHRIKHEKVGIQTKNNTPLQKWVLVQKGDGFVQCYDTPSLWNKSTRVLNATGLTRLFDSGSKFNGKGKADIKKTY